MISIQSHLNMLGFKVKDVVTGFAGVVTSVSFDLYGCVQYVVTPPSPKDSDKAEHQTSRWFDAKRLARQGKDRVMAVPDFVEVPGGQRLPPKQ